jgi:hypothetical protein
MDIDQVFVTNPVRYWLLLRQKMIEYKGTIPNVLMTSFVPDDLNLLESHAIKVANNTLHIMQAHILRYYYFDMYPQPWTRFDKNEKLKCIEQFVKDVDGGAVINEGWYRFSMGRYRRYFPEIPEDYQSLLSL